MDTIFIYICSIIWIIGWFYMIYILYFKKCECDSNAIICDKYGNKIDEGKLNDILRPKNRSDVVFEVTLCFFVWPLALLELLKSSVKEYFKNKGAS